MDGWDERGKRNTRCGRSPQTSESADLKRKSLGVITTGYEKFVSAIAVERPVKISGGVDLCRYLCFRNEKGHIQDYGISEKDRAKLITLSLLFDN